MAFGASIGARTSERSERAVRTSTAIGSLAALTPRPGARHPEAPSGLHRCRRDIGRAVLDGFEVSDHTPIIVPHVIDATATIEIDATLALIVGWLEPA